MIDRSDASWYRDAIIYQLHVKSFFDSNDDGVGDFQGVTRKLDYIRDLGATAIWLMPFYPSPLRDDGYDISDYRGINPAYGDMREFRRFVREAHARGLRVITELVINHTSDQHPWFQRARNAKPGSAARDFYVWSETDRIYKDARIIFLDTETSNWTWDPVAKAYYWHRFYSHQPDLNFDNPRVLQAVLDTMRYWLDMGVDGLRLDAIPYLIERDETNCENLPETHEVIRAIRAAVDASYPDRMLLAEANQWPEETAPYFGKGDECHMAFHFPLMPRMYMALAMEDRHPITDIMRQTPEIPEGAQWAIFLRNHDELTLEMVTDKERDYLWSFYASESRARINLGIRRRLAPLLGNDRRKTELLKSLLLSMPGTPVLYYGDEIGMGDNIYLGDRDGVRTPMQWSPDRNGGFSRADPAKLFLPAIQDPIYGFSSVNVEAQLASQSSMLNWLRRMIAVRRHHRAFGRGALRFLYPDNRKVLAYLREFDDERILCVANVSRAPQAVELDLAEFRGAIPIELSGGSAFPQIGGLPYLLTLPAYGFYWFQLDTSAPQTQRFGPAAQPELFTLVLTGSAQNLLNGREAAAFERTIAPQFLRTRRWFAGKSDGIKRIDAQTLCALRPAAGRDIAYLLMRIDAQLLNGAPQSYFSPLAVDEAKEDEAVLPYAVARVRRGSRIGLAYDADADPGFGRAIVAAMQSRESLPTPDGGHVMFEGADELKGIALDQLEGKRIAAEQSNSTLALGEEAILKIYRRLHKGPNPEIEVSRFLSEPGRFDGSPAYLGSVVHVDADGVPTPLAVLHRFIRNQGDGWTRAVDAFRLALEELLTPPPESEPSAAEAFASYLLTAQTLGRRTAEMHRALAGPSDDDSFTVEPMSQADLEESCMEASRQAARAFEAVERAHVGAGEALGARMEALLARKDEALDSLRRLARTPIVANKMRIHGDFHLGQTLVVQKDMMIVDFEGEPSRPLEQRRAKDTPLRDVAGMLRSMSYVGATAVQAIEQRVLTDPARAERLASEGVALVSDAFLASYREHVAGTPADVADDASRTALLQLKLLAKGLYEINYEAEFRPAWIGVPINGVLSLLDGMRAEP
ncbi:MAG: trehalose synthase [Hyphomicrobiales bacterium]|nr:trehalose synthase [Hyphomicrobiales bacterium]